MAMLAGCATWRQQWLTPQAVLRNEHPAVLRATLRDGSRVVLANPAIEHDSLAGISGGRRSVVALSDVAYVSLRYPDQARGTASIGLGVAAGLLALLAATWNN
jgi:hypothetical protein